MNGTTQPAAPAPEPNPQNPPAGPGKADDGKSDNKAGSLASIGMLVAPLIAAIGGLALTGTIGRVQRDNPEGISIAIGLVIAAGVLWVVTETFTAPKAGEKRSKADFILRSLAFLFAGGGFILALVVAVGTADNEPRPQITPSISDDGTKLTTHVTASNLPTNQRLAFRINLLKDEEVVSTPYRSYVGPNSDGAVDQTLTIALPAGDYTEIEIKGFTGTSSASCDDFSEVLESSTFGSGTGCVIIAVPSRRESDANKTKSTNVKKTTPDPKQTGRGRARRR